MEDRGRQDRVRAAAADAVRQMLQIPHSTRSDHRDWHRFGDRPGQLQIVAVLRSVPVHRGEQDLSRSPFLGFARPLHRVFSGRRPAAVHKNFPTAALPLSVDRHHHALAAEPPSGFGDQPRIFDRCRVEGDLVRPGGEDLTDLLDALDAAADRERDKNLFGDTGREGNAGITPLGRGGDVQKDQLIRPLFLVAPARFNRVAGVFKF